jgi:S-adenosylmethionine:tRNA-ribosyltransferase-isomerase (queuine synthetase)
MVQHEMHSVKTDSKYFQGSEDAEITLPICTPAHSPLLTNVPDAHAMASLSVAVVQATAVALATGVHAAGKRIFCAGAFVRHIVTSRITGV